MFHTSHHCPAVCTPAQRPINFDSTAITAEGRTGDEADGSLWSELHFLHKTCEDDQRYYNTICVFPDETALYIKGIVFPNLRGGIASGVNIL